MLCLSYTPYTQIVVRVAPDAQRQARNLDLARGLVEFVQHERRHGDQFAERGCGVKLCALLLALRRYLHELAEGLDFGLRGGADIDWRKGIAASISVLLLRVGCAAVLLLGSGCATTPPPVAVPFAAGTVAPEKKSKEGEGCLKSADCEGALGCMDGKCKAAATGSDVSNAQDAVATDSDGEDGAGSDARNDDLADAGEDTAPGEVVGQDATGCVPKCPSDDCKDGCGGICEGTCEDGNLCTAGDHCEAGACKPASTKLCNDGNDCTYDGCAPAMGCVFTALEGAACPDGWPAISPTSASQRRFPLARRAAGRPTGRAPSCVARRSPCSTNADCDEHHRPQWRRPPPARP